MKKTTDYSLVIDSQIFLVGLSMIYAVKINLIRIKFLLTGFLQGLKGFGTVFARIRGGTKI